MKEKKTLKDILKAFFWIAIFTGCFYLFLRFIAVRIVVDGQSMYNTLEDQEYVLVDKLLYKFSDVKRYDIIVFDEEYSSTGYFIKRVIGLPGETVKIDGNGTIYINGEKIKESYGYEPIQFSGLAMDGISLGEDEYFVLGDNRNNSEDSRFSIIGNIKKEEILGKVYLRLYPFEKFGLIDLYKERTAEAN